MAASHAAASTAVAWRAGVQRRYPLLRGTDLDVGCVDRWVAAYCDTGAYYVGLDFPATGRDRYFAKPDFLQMPRSCRLRTRRSTQLCVLRCLSSARSDICVCGVSPAAPLSTLAEHGVLVSGACAPHDYQRLTSHGLRHDLEQVRYVDPRIEKTGHPVKTTGPLGLSGFRRRLLRGDSSC